MPKSPTQIREDRIAAEAKTRTRKLDLSNLGLPSLPESLFTLYHLCNLDLGIDYSEPGEPESNLFALQPLRKQFIL